MMQRKFLLLALLLLLISVGIVVAQSSPNFSVQRTAMLSGGATDSVNYSVTSVIGQPAAGIGSGANYKVSAGFLQPDSGNVVFLPMITN